MLAWLVIFVCYAGNQGYGAVNMTNDISQVNFFRFFDQEISPSFTFFTCQDSHLLEVKQNGFQKFSWYVFGLAILLIKIGPLLYSFASLTNAKIEYCAFFDNINPVF